MSGIEPRLKTAPVHRNHHLLVRQKLIDAAEGRLITVTEEFEKAFSILEKYEKTVTIFGSARLTPDSQAYKDAYTMAQVLASQGYAVVTGGGLGIMEAANRGAFEAGGASIGFNIQLPTEQHLNDYTTEHLTFEHFFGRKVALTLESRAYIYFSGGFGTLDELFEILTLEQTGVVPRIPTILYGSDFWQPMMSYINKNLDNKNHTITSGDQDIVTICDDQYEVMELINSHYHDADRLPTGAKPHSRLSSSS